MTTSQKKGNTNIVSTDRVTNGGTNVRKCYFSSSNVTLNQFYMIQILFLCRPRTRTSDVNSSTYWNSGSGPLGAIMNADIQVRGDSKVCQRPSPFTSRDRKPDFAATKQLEEHLFTSVCPSVCPSVTPLSLCSHYRIIMKFSEVIINDRSDIHAKGQGHRPEVKVTCRGQNLA